MATCGRVVVGRHTTWQINTLSGKQWQHWCYSSHHKLMVLFKSKHSCTKWGIPMHQTSNNLHRVSNVIEQEFISLITRRSKSLLCNQNTRRADWNNRDNGEVTHYIVWTLDIFTINYCKACTICYNAVTVQEFNIGQHYHKARVFHWSMHIDWHFWVIIIHHQPKT